MPGVSPAAVPIATASLHASGSHAFFSTDIANPATVESPALTVLRAVTWGVVAFTVSVWLGAISPYLPVEITAIATPI